MPLATLPGCGPITTHQEGPHSHIKCHRVKVFVQTKPQTRLQCAQGHATVVLVNDTRTQCTTSLPPHKGAAALRRTKNGKESQRKINLETIKELAPHQPRPELSQWSRPQCTIFRTIHAGSAHRTRLPPTHRPPTSTVPTTTDSPVASYSQSHHQPFFRFPLFRRQR